MAQEEGKWVTVAGRRIFIPDGQTLEQAMNSKGSSTSKAKSASSKGVKKFNKTWNDEGVTFPDGTVIKKGDTYAGYKITGFVPGTNSVKLGDSSYSADELKEWMQEEKQKKAKNGR